MTDNELLARIVVDPKVMAGKPVIVHGTLDAEEMAYFVSSLESTGLYIAARAHSAASAKHPARS